MRSRGTLSRCAQQMDEFLARRGCGAIDRPPVSYKNSRRTAGQLGPAFEMHADHFGGREG